MEQSYYKEFIKDVPNHPKNGILFRDIQPLLADARVFEDAINDMLDLVKFYETDYYVGIESRGFIFSTALAWSGNRGNKLIRKAGKLPPKDLESVSYHTEYSVDTIQMEKGSGRVIVVDDVFATGGTMQAAVDLATKSGYEVIDTLCLIDIGIVKNHKTKCLISY